MTASLPTRAPTRSIGGRRSPHRRRAARLGMATTVLLAGLAWTIRAEVTPAVTAGQRTPPAGASDATVAPTRDVEAPADRVPATVPPPQPLAPAPPADGRDAPDPFLLADGGRYLLYSTQVGFHNVPVATSADMHNWSPPSDALPQLPGWAAWGRTWAPGVTRLDGGYVLYFAALHASFGRQCIGVATSATANGPFASPATEPLVCQTERGGSIDPHPFVDADGTPYLLWKADGNAIGQTSTLFAQRLTSDGLAFVGEPVELVSSGAAWEEPLIENPALVATDGSYVLFYSGGWWESSGYAVGYATCDTPLGPCTKATVTEPLFGTGGDQAGPGGACVIAGPAGDQWLAYHAWTSGAIGYDRGGARSLRFASLTWPKNQPAVAR